MKNLFIVFLFISFYSYAQENKKNNFFNFLWGKPVGKNLSFMPLANHTRILKNKDFFEIYYSSFSYKSVELAVFKNSFSDWTTGIFYKRKITIGKRFSFDYGGGVLYGYKSNLLKVKGLPHKFKEFFFGHAICPALGSRINYHINKKLSITILIVPLVNAYGLTYNF